MSNIFDIMDFLREVFLKKADIEIVFREYNGYRWVTKGTSVMGHVMSDDEDPEDPEDPIDLDIYDADDIVDVALQLLYDVERGHLVRMINCRT